MRVKMINAICLLVVFEKRISTNQTGIAISGRKRAAARQLNINLSNGTKSSQEGGFIIKLRSIVSIIFLFIITFILQSVSS